MEVVNDRLSAMVSCTIQLYNGVSPPLWPLKIEHGEKVREEELHGQLVGVGLHHGPVDVALGVDGHYQR